MTKADQIRDLYAKGYSVKEIADAIGCREEYVRVCARQRADGNSKADEKYLSANREARLARMREQNRKRYAEDPEYRMYVKERNRARYQQSSA